MVNIRKIDREAGGRYSGDALVALPNESYGHKMRRLRLLLDLSQGDVADMVGTTQETISVWERGKRFGVTPEASRIPRYVIRLLTERLRRKRKRDALDSGGLAGSVSPGGVGSEPLVSLPERRLRRA